MTDLKCRIEQLAVNRKKKCTQLEVSKMTGVSRSHIANFENGRVNNAYLYDFYINHFGGPDNETN